MKKLIFLFMILASVACVQSQPVPLAVRMDLVTWISLEQADYLTGGKVGTLNIEVRNYDVYQTASGQYYVNYTNSRLTQSRKYLGYTHGFDYKYENNTVFFNSDTTKAWLWTVDRYGQIFKMDLPDYFATDLKKDSIQ